MARQVDVLAGMNPHQREAVAHIDGPLLVVAGAGSGKTRVITHRIANLIQNGVREDRILAITFTNKAAGEMKERVERLLGIITPWISTFHSVGLRILKLEKDRLGFPGEFVINDEDEQKRLFKRIFKDLRIDEKELPVRYCQWQISQWKNQLLFPDNVSARRDDRQDVALQVYKVYHEINQEESRVDFDDLLLRPVKLFDEDEELLQKYRDRFPYILIDEYQDTNTAQYKLIRQLGAHGNVCATGDPDQAIYGWRGADIRNILQFEKDFEGCKTVLLEQNYRSTKCILRAAQAVVEHNTERKDKTIFTENPEGKSLVVITVDDNEEEAKAISVRAQTLVREGRNWREISVFYRTNAQSRVIEEEFIRRNIPYRIVGGTRFYDRREIKDVLAYLKLLVNPRETISFDRVLNVPARGIGAKSQSQLLRLCREEGVGFHEVLMNDDLLERVAVGRTARALKSFALLWRRLHALDQSDGAKVVEEVISLTHLGEFYLQREPGEVGEERVKNIGELVTVARQVGGSLVDLLDHAALYTSQDTRTDADEVLMMTLHASKGLEFPVVFITGCEQGVLPLVRHGQPCDYEEERRLMYVGITRAMQELYISRAVLRQQFGETKRNPPSMFLGEIPDGCIEHKDRTGRCIKPVELSDDDFGDGPAYPEDSVASVLAGARPKGEKGEALLKQLQEHGALTSGAALQSAMRSGISHDGVARKRRIIRRDDEPVELEGDPYHPGERILHQTFGAGEVVRLSGPASNRSIHIRFDSIGEKELLLRFAGKRLSHA